MSITSEAKKKILTQFTREVWSEGNVEASDKYIAPRYTIHHDPGDPWEGRELDLAGYKDRVKMLRAAFPDQLFDHTRTLCRRQRCRDDLALVGHAQGRYPGISRHRKEDQDVRRHRLLFRRHSSHRTLADY